MRHVIYAGDVHAEEPVTTPDVKPLKLFRVKAPDGSYQIIGTDETPEVIATGCSNGAEGAEPKGKKK